MSDSAEVKRLRAKVERLERALDRIVKAHAPAEHLQDIARAALADEAEDGSHD